MKDHLKSCYKSMKSLQDAHEAFRAEAGLRANELAAGLQHLTDGGHLGDSQSLGYRGAYARSVKKFGKRVRQLTKSVDGMHSHLSKLFDSVALSQRFDPDVLRAAAISEDKSISGLQAAGGRHAGMSLNTNFPRDIEVQPSRLQTASPASKAEHTQLAKQNLKGLNSWELEKVRRDLNSSMKKSQRNKEITRVPSCLKDPFSNMRSK
jgi:hypothetical protein